MRVCVEATSLLGPRSGVGHTTASLVEALVASDPDLEVVLLPLSLRGGGDLRRVAPRHPRVTPLRSRVPARLAYRVWTRSDWPPAELLCGAVDVFHGPNFLLPPLLRAAGVLTVHDLSFLHLPETCSPHERSYRETVPVSAARAARVIVPSSFVAGELSEWLPAVAGRVSVVPWGLRPAFTEPVGPLAAPRRAELGLRGPYVAYVGNLEWRKNLGVLLEAFARLREKLSDVQLALVGRPSVGWAQIASAWEPLFACGAVVEAGYLPDREVAALVRGARAFAYPSRYEGFGLPPLEAMAVGTPVVASRSSAMPEVLGDHVRYVDPADAAGLADALAAAVTEEPDPAAQQAARQWALSYTWERAAGRTLEVYREASGA